MLAFIVGDDEFYAQTFHRQNDHRKRMSVYSNFSTTPPISFKRQTESCFGLQIDPVTLRHNRVIYTCHYVVAFWLRMIKHRIIFDFLSTFIDRSTNRSAFQVKQRKRHENELHGWLGEVLLIHTPTITCQRSSAGIFTRTGCATYISLTDTVSRFPDVLCSRPSQNPSTAFISIPSHRCPYYPHPALARDDDVTPEGKCAIYPLAWPPFPSAWGYPPKRPCPSRAQGFCPGS